MIGDLIVEPITTAQEAIATSLANGGRIPPLLWSRENWKTLFEGCDCIQHWTDGTIFTGQGWSVRLLPRTHKQG